MDKKLTVYNARAAVNICFIVVLIFVGLLLNSRIKTLLYRFTEGQVSRQAATVAEMASVVFDSEYTKLEYRSSVAEKNPDSVGNVLGSMQMSEPDIKLGLLNINGEALFGDPFLPSDFPCIQSSFRGNAAVSYNSVHGLLFSTPVFSGDNIKYVLYELFPVDKIGKYFGLSCYDGMGSVLVISKKNETIIPFNRTTDEDTAFFFSDEFKDVPSELMRRLDLSASASKLTHTSRGDYYVFTANIPGTELYIAGFVSADIAAEGAYDIVLLVGRVFELITILFAIGSIYLIITSTKIRENDELIKAKQIAEEASHAKSDFLASMSHEIRTPINAVLGMDELILREYDDPTLRQYAMNIRNAGNTLLSIINDILDFSKIESGKMELVPVDYDISLMIYDLVSMTRPRAEKKGLTFVVKANENIPHTLHGDNIRLKQCVLNILTNAVKYTENGSVLLTFDFEKAGERSIMLNVSVKDTGIGIKADDLEKLFSPFERVDLVRNRSIEGTGLGMSIVKKLLAMMDTKLDVKSVYGKGSEFSFSVRQEVRSWVVMGDYEKNYIHTIQAQSDYHQKFTAPTARILIVDDIEMNLTVAAGLLKKTEIMIDTSLSAKNALELTDKKEYDVIFIDDRMPGMGGVEMLKELRSRKDGPNASKPCIALTANAIAGAKEIYIKEGFEDYLSKPIDSMELEKMLLRYLPGEKVVANAFGYRSKAQDAEEEKLDSIKEYIGTDDKLYDAVQLLMNRTRK